MPDRDWKERNFGAQAFKKTYKMIGAKSMTDLVSHNVVTEAVNKGIEITRDLAVSSLDPIVSAPIGHLTDAILQKRRPNISFESSPSGPEYIPSASPDPYPSEESPPTFPFQMFNIDTGKLESMFELDTNEYKFVYCILSHSWRGAEISYEFVQKVKERVSKGLKVTEEASKGKYGHLDMKDSEKVTEEASQGKYGHLDLKDSENDVKNIIQQCKHDIEAAAPTTKQSKDQMGLLYQHFISAHKIANTVEKAKEIFATQFQDQYLVKDKWKRYVWDDTCCINKAVVNEHNHSLAMMGEWYTNAKFCLVYLDDNTTPADSNPNDRKDDYKRISLEERYHLLQAQSYPKARFETFEDIYQGLASTPGADNGKQLNEKRRPHWSSRAWTLQELCLSREVFFYNNAWKLLNPGGKGIIQSDPDTKNLKHNVALFSNVPAKEVCRGGRQTEYPASTVLALAATRACTVPTDQAYSLMGMLGVKFPAFHAEGVTKALTRLLDETVITSNDVSIFNWWGANCGSPVKGRSLYPCNFTGFDSEKIEKDIQELEDEERMEREIRIKKEKKEEDENAKESREEDEKGMGRERETKRKRSEEDEGDIERETKRKRDEETGKEMHPDVPDGSDSSNGHGQDQLTPRVLQNDLDGGSLLKIYCAYKELEAIMQGAERFITEEKNTHLIAQLEPSIEHLVKYIKGVKPEEWPLIMSTGKVRRIFEILENSDAYQDLQKCFTQACKDMTEPKTKEELSGEKSGKTSSKSKHRIFSRPKLGRSHFTKNTRNTVTNVLLKIGIKHDPKFPEFLKDAIAKHVPTSRENAGQPSGSTSTCSQDTGVAEDDSTIIVSKLQENIGALLKKPNVGNKDGGVGKNTDHGKPKHDREDNNGKPKDQPTDGDSSNPEDNTRDDDSSKLENHTGAEGSKSTISPNPIIIDNSGIESVFDIQRVVVTFDHCETVDENGKNIAHWRSEFDDAIRKGHMDKQITGKCTISTGCVAVKVKFSCSAAMLRKQLDICDVVEQTMLKPRKEVEHKSGEPTTEDRRVELMVKFIQQTDVSLMAGEWVLMRFSGVPTANWFLGLLELGSTHEFYGWRIPTTMIDFGKARAEKGIQNYWARYMEEKAKCTCDLLGFMAQKKRFQSDTAEKIADGSEDNLKDASTDEPIMKGVSPDEPNKLQATMDSFIRFAGGWTMRLNEAHKKKYLRDKALTEAEIPKSLQAAVLSLDENTTLPAMFTAAQRVHMF